MKRLRILLVAGILFGPAVSNGDEEVVPGDNLLVDGIPPIPRSRAVEVARYREFRRASFLDWHPARKEMLIGTRLGNTNQLHQVRSPGDERDPKMRAFLDQTAPLSNADKIRKPLFVIQGKKDPRVPLAEAEQLVAAVKKNGTPVWYLMAKDEGHGFAKKNNADFQFYATVMFMKNCLLK